jgi:hypothetical protein
MEERVYKCASCGRETVAVFNNRNEKRCIFCYAVLSDAMLVPEPSVVVPEPAAPLPGLSVGQEQKAEPVVEPGQRPAAENATGKRRLKP